MFNLLFADDSDSDGVELTPVATKGVGQNSDAGFRASDDNGNDADVIDVDEDDGKVQLCQWSPIYLLSEWKMPKIRTKWICAAILLPSGVCEEDFQASVSEDGLFIEISVQWPAPIVDIDLLHKYWVDTSLQTGFELFHPRVTGFEETLSRHRPRASEKVLYSARIRLPFVVLPHIVEHEIPKFIQQGSSSMIVGNLVIIPHPSMQLFRSMIC